MTTETNNAMAEALAGGYLLADVTIRRFAGFKKDKLASAEVCQNHGTTTNAAKVQKDLLAGARAELKEVAATQDAIRSYLYTNTLPWNASSDGRNSGSRLLPTSKSLTFLKDFKVMHNAYVVALTNFLSVYDQRRQQAMLNLGTLADINDYPDAAEIAGMFAVDIDINPVPSPTDFSRLSIPAPLADSLGNIIAKKQDTAMRNALADLNERIVSELKRMATQLGKFGKGEKTRLYASLVDNMTGLTDLLRHSNFASDAKLDELADRLEKCTRHDIKTIKANPTVATEIAAQAVAITSDIEAELYF